MARRRTYDPGDWHSVARRIDEVLHAHSGEDVFHEVVKLVIAKVHAERAGVDFTPENEANLNVLLAAAAWRWPGVLQSGETRLGPTAIQRAAEILRSVRLGDDHLEGLSALFQAIISRSARGEKGQFFTPLPIVRDIVLRVWPAAGESVCDPACGIGGFLLEALRFAPGCEVWGFDQDARVVPVARALLVMAGECGTHARQLDSLSFGSIEEGMPPGFAGFDVVLTNPPFAGDVGEGAGQGYELARGRAVERDALFLERCIGLLRAGGRFGIVVPDNKVSAQRFAFVRNWLLCHARLSAVVALDRQAFMPWTSQKACVLVGSKRAEALDMPARDEEIDLVSASGTISVRSVAELDPGWVLAPERYAARVAAAGAVISDVVDVLTEVHRPSALPQGKPALVLDTSHAYEGFVLDSHALVPVEKVGSPKQVLQPGDVIISRLRSYLRQVALVDEALFWRVPEGNLVLASAEFVVLRGRGAGRPASPTNPPVPAPALLPLLLSEPVQAALAASQEGGHHPRFRKETLAAIPVPDDIRGNAPAIAARVVQASAKVRDAFAQVQGLARALASADDRRKAPSAVPADRTRHGDQRG